MSTEIGHVKGVQTTAAQERERLTRNNGIRPGTPGGAAPGDRADAVSLSTGALNLLELQQRLSEQPEVDQGRVEAIRQALSQGSYRIDVNRLADSLLTQEVQLLTGVTR